MKKQSKTETQEEETADLSLLSRLMDQENEDNIFLFDEKGNEIELQQVATIMHEDKIYAIMHPLTAAEDEAVVFLIDPVDEESICIVDDDKLAEKILEIYHEKAGL